MSAKTPNGVNLPPPPSYDETTNEPRNMYEVLQFQEHVHKKHKFSTREFRSLILGFSGLPQNHEGSGGLHKYDDLLLGAVRSLHEHFEELRMGLRWLANHFGAHQRSYPHSPPTSPPPHPLDLGPSSTFPELTGILLQQIHKLTASVEKTYEKIAELNRRMRPVLFKRTENIFHKNFGLAKGWQMVHHVEPNIDDWVKWMGTLDARAVLLKLDLERQVDLENDSD